MVNHLKPKNHTTQPNIKYHNNVSQSINMVQTTLSMRIDEDVKDRFEFICKSLGLTMASALMMYICEVNREERIPLSLSLKKDRRTEVIEALRRMSASGPAELTLEDINDEIRTYRESTG